MINIYRLWIIIIKSFLWERIFAVEVFKQGHGIKTQGRVNFDSRIYNLHLILVREKKNQCNTSHRWPLVKSMLVINNWFGFSKHHKNVAFCQHGEHWMLFLSPLHISMHQVSHWVIEIHYSFLISFLIYFNKNTYEL